MLKRISRAVVALGLSLAATSWVFAGDITVENAWVRSAPPGATVLGAYLTIKNNGDKAITLTGVSCDVATQTEIHQTTQHNGMSRMQPIKEIPIPTHDQVKLEPGGYHLMLVKPKRALKPGDHVSCTLSFDAGVQQTVHAEVRDATTEPNEHDMSRHRH